MQRGPDQQEQRARVQSPDRLPHEIETSFRQYAYRLLGSFGIFEANANASMPRGEAQDVDQHFIDRFAAHMMHHSDPAVSARTSDLQVPFIIWGNEDPHSLEETIAYDTAARRAFNLVVDDSKARGKHEELLDQLRKVRHGKRLWLPEYNMPSLGWEVRRIYRECREGLANRRKY